MQLTNNLIDQDKIITMQQIIDAYRGDKFAKYRVLEKKLLQVKRELKEKNLGTTEKKEKVDAIGALVNAFEQERGQKTGLIHAIKSLAQRLFYTLGTPFSADYREAKKLIIEDLMEYEKEELHCESVPNNKESRFLFDLIYEQRFDTNNEKQCRLMRRKMYNIIHSRSSIHNFYQAFRGLNLKIQREIVDYFLDISDRYKVESTEFEKSHNASNSGEFVAHYVEDRHAYNLLQYIQEQALNGSEIDDNTMEMINKLNADYTRAQRFRRKARYLVWNWGMPDYARGPFITVKSCFGEPVGSL
ncbi:MAG: hypothetical protein ACE5HI_14875, partial [bacterium]